MTQALRGLMQLAIGFVFGLALGYALAQVLAPTEGEETRRRLEREAETLRQRPRKAATEAQSRIHHAIEEGRRAAEDARAELEAQAGLIRPRPVEAPVANPGKAPL
jgi:hypothetical protein